MINCCRHNDQPLTWLCLNKKCKQRVMCSICAVKVHDRSHKLEELSKGIENGIMRNYGNNEDNLDIEQLQINTNIPQNQQNEMEQQIIEKLRVQVRQICCEIEMNKSELVQQLEQKQLMNEQVKQELIDELQEIDCLIQSQQYNTADELNSLFVQGFNLIEGYVEQQQRYQNKQQNTQESLIYKKIQILDYIHESFLKLISSYVDNIFTSSFSSFFNIQLQTLNAQTINYTHDDQSQQELTDKFGFLDYISKKWAQDYNNINYSINKFVNKLNEGLDYLVNLPLGQSNLKYHHHHQQQQQQQLQYQQHFVTMPLQCIQPEPQQYLIQQDPYFQQPFLMQSPPQMYIQQPVQMLSPVNTRMFDEQQHVSQNMCQSHIVYSYDQDKSPNKVEMQPVCQQKRQPSNLPKDIQEEIQNPAKDNTQEQLKKMNATLNQFLSKLKPNS